MQQCPSCDSATTYLEAEDVRRVVAQGLELGDGALDHGRRPAAEDVGVGPRRRHRLLEHRRVDEALNLLKGHHCWVLRAFASAFAHRRACRRSHEYSGDPFDPRRLTVALYDNCSSQIALASACQRAALWDLANCETWYSKTRGRVGSIFRPATPHPKESWRRRGAVQLASRTAHTRRQRNSTDRRLWHSLSVPAAPVRGTNHDV